MSSDNAVFNVDANPSSSILLSEQTLPIDWNKSGRNALGTSHLSDETLIDTPKNRANATNSMPDLSVSSLRRIQPMTLREYEEQLSDLKKENFNLKLKIFKLQSMLKGTNSEDVRVDLQVEVDEYETQIRTKTELCKRLQEKLDNSNHKHKDVVKDCEKKYSQVQFKLEKSEIEVESLNKRLAETQKALNEERSKNEQLAEALACRRNDEFGGSDSDGLSQISLLGEKDRDILDLRSQMARLEYELELKKDEVNGLRITNDVSISVDPATPRADATGVEYGSIIYQPELEEILKKKVMDLETEVDVLVGKLAESETQADKRNKVIQGLTNKIQKMKTEGLTVSSVPSNWVTKNDEPIETSKISVINAKSSIECDQTLEVLQSRCAALMSHNEELQQVVRAQAVQDDTPDEEMSRLMQFCDNSLNISQLLRDRLIRYVQSRENDGSLVERLAAIDQTGSVLFQRTPQQYAHATPDTMITPASISTPSFLAAPPPGVETTPKSTTTPTISSSIVNWGQRVDNNGENEASFVMAETLVELHTAANLLNDTLENSSQDLATLRKNFNDLRTVCKRLYTKLRGSYQFLKDMLTQLGSEDLASRFQDDFSLLSQQLQDSLSTAQDVLDGADSSDRRLTRLATDLNNVTRRLSLVASTADESLNDMSHSHSHAGGDSPNLAPPIRSGASSSQSEGNEPDQISRIPRKIMNNVSQSPRNLIILKEQIKCVESARKEMQGDLETKCMEYDSLVIQLEGANAKMGEQNKELDLLNERIGDLREEVKRKEGEVERERRKWKGEGEKLKQEYEEMKKCAEEYEVQLKRKQDEVISLRDQISAQSSTEVIREQYESELNRMHAQLETTQAELRAQTDQCKQVQQHLNMANQEINKLNIQKAAVERATQQLAQFQNIVGGLQSQVEQNEAKFESEKRGLEGELVEERNRAKMMHQEMLRIAEELKVWRFFRFFSIEILDNFVVFYVSRDETISPMTLADKVAESACKHRLEIERLKQALEELHKGRSQLKSALEDSLSRLENGGERERELMQKQERIVKENEAFLEAEKHLKDQISNISNKCEALQKIMEAERETSKKTVEAFDAKIKKTKERHEEKMAALLKTVDKMAAEKSKATVVSQGCNTLETLGDLENLHIKIRDLGGTINEQKKQIDSYSSTLHKYTQINKELSATSPSRQLERVMRVEKEKKDSLQDIVTQLEINNRLLEQKLDDNEKIRGQDSQSITSLKRQLKETQKMVQAVEGERQALLNRLQQTPSSTDGDHKAGSLPEADMPSPRDRLNQDRPRSSGSGMGRPDSTVLSPEQKQPMLYNELNAAVKELRRATKAVKGGQTDPDGFDWKKCLDGLHATRYSVELCLRVVNDDKENRSGQNNSARKDRDYQFLSQKNEFLIQENGQLKELLSSSQSLLASAQDKFAYRSGSVPQDLQQGIVRELAKIRQVLQQSRGDLHNQRSNGNNRYQLQ